MKKTLEHFKPSHSFLVCIDSDGCTYDVMELKHKECFCPATINFWNLQAVGRYARETWEFVNLYSSSRGINRFLALEKVLDILSQKREIKALTDFAMPDYDELKKWINSGEPLNNHSLEKHRDNPQLLRTLEWSLDCNHRINEMVRGVPPFPYVRESLKKLSQKADIVIVSATATEALIREWDEHQLLPLVSAVCGQENGNKTQCISKVKQYYADTHCIMIGDAPGDHDAAHANGILFYPICPLEEADSWKEFCQKDMNLFFDGSYAGEREKQVIRAFNLKLPQTPV